MASSDVLTTRALNRATLARQMLLAREETTALKTIRRLVALQAQLARPPFLGLWSRVVDFERDDLLKPIRKRQVVRGTSLRGTLHLMAADDFVALRGAIQPALTRGMLSILRDRLKGLDLDALTAAARAFFGEAPATFDALRRDLKKKTPKADERAIAYAIRMHLPLVQVPTDAQWGFPAQSDFAMADAWLGKSVPTEAKPAHEIVRRYLAAFGPATPGDAQVWSGLSGLRDVFEEMRPTLVTFRDARKRELFDLPKAPRPPDDSPAPVRFLPEFDNLLLSHDDRSRVIADEYRPRLMSKNLIGLRTILVDGFVAGTWSIERKKKLATLRIEPWHAIAKKHVAALEGEGEGMLRFAEEDAPAREVRFAK